MPHRQPRVLLLPERPALWAPVPAAWTAGGPQYRPVPLDADALALWRAFNGARTLAAAASRAGVPVDRATALVAAWTDAGVQLVQLWPAGARPRELSQAAPARPDHPRAADHHDDLGRTTLDRYHDQMPAHRRFDDIETTVAHVWSEPSGALQGSVYGARVRERLRARIGDRVDGTVVEIGPGTGRLAAAFGDPARFVRVDRSPALLAAQAELLPGSHGVLASATCLPFRDRSVPLVLCNEVAADLAAVPVGAPSPEVEQRIERYELDRCPPGSFHNLGAWQLVEELARVLAPGGVAWLTEFGAVDAPPAEAVQLDHPEVSIHPGHLVRIAGALGLRAELHRLDDWLGVDLSARHLARRSWEGVRALAPSLEARAWTPISLAAALPERVEGLEWVPVTEPGPGPLVTRFFALVLERSPAAEASSRS
ncbi:MAG: methyltransferase domain-containing protein [Myxococcota bacterium]